MNNMHSNNLNLEEKQSLFTSIGNENESDVNEIISYCVQCGENGITKMLLTKIPFYKEIIIMSFECSHCGFKNNEIQSGAKIQEKGIKMKIKVANQKDLSRLVVKSEWASVFIPEVDLEIPARSHPGEMTTIEGVVNRTIDALSAEMELRKKDDENLATKLDKFLQKMKIIQMVSQPFTFVVDDITGNSFIENLNAPQLDPQLEVSYYMRTSEQDHKLGLNLHCEDQNSELEKNIQNEVLSFATNCPECNAPCQTNMKVTDIPYFKQVVIMATNCDICGLRTNEVKAGAGIEATGVKITLKLNIPGDLSRDVLKSETCYIRIPELDLEVGSAALYGCFTTIEGLLLAMKNQILQECPLMSGDSADSQLKQRLLSFGQKIDEILEGKISAHLILDDPAGNSYLQNPYAPDADPDLKIEYYERSFQQNEELGLNDMRTENYEN